MATLYITTNANSGSGSLRALLATAAAGDVIQPDPDVFPAGTPCEIVLGSNLSVTKAVSICGAQTRIRITANGAAYSIYVTAGIGSVVTFEDVDFVNLRSDNYGGAFRINGPDKVVLRRCLGVGNRGKYGGIAHVANSTNRETALMLYDSAFYGNYASTTAAFVYFQGPVYEKAWIENCTYAANVCPAGNAAFNYTPPSERRPNVVTNTSNWLTPPDDSYSAATWTLNSWRAMNPRPVAVATNAIETDSIFDLDGNFRYENVDEQGNLYGGALGAYELITADLYWVGLDENGNDVSYGSFASPIGWANSPHATMCGFVAPSAGQTLYIAKSATFYDAPGAGSTLIVAPRVAVLMQGTDRTINVTLGLGVTLDTDDKTFAIESPIIKNAPYSQLLAPVQQSQNYPAESFFMEGYIDNFFTVASNHISRYPSYGKLVIHGVDDKEELFHEIAGVYHAKSVVIRSSGSHGTGRYVRFGDRYLERAGDATEYRQAAPEFHCESFTAIDVDWDEDIKPVVYAKRLVTINTVELQDLPSAPFIVDLSEAEPGIELTLYQQEIRNLDVPVSLVGDATINGGTFDASLITSPLRSSLVVKNCVVVGETLEVVDYDLYINGGSLAPTSIIVRSTSTGLTTPTLIIDGVSGLTTIQNLTVVFGQFHLVGGAVTINELTTIGATIQFENCASVRYDGVLNQAYLILSNVALAQFGTLVLTGLQTYLSTIDVSGSLSADAVTINDSTVDIAGSLNAPIVSLQDASELSVANLTATSLGVVSSILTFSGIAKGTAATIQDSTINGGESSRLSFRTLILHDANVVAQTLCSMTQAEYDSLDSSSPSAPISCVGGSLSVGSLVVYPTETVQLAGSLMIESASIRGTARFAENTSARFDALTVAESGALAFAEPDESESAYGIALFEVDALALSSGAEISAEVVNIASMSFACDVTISSASVSLGSLSPINGAKLIGRGERFAINPTNEKELLLDLDCLDLFSAQTLRLADASAIKADTVQLSGVTLSSGDVSFRNVENGAFGKIDAGTGTLTIVGNEIAATSLIGAVTIRGVSINLTSVEIADDSAIEGTYVAIRKLTSTGSGYSAIAGTSSVTITECAVAHNLTLVGGAINGALGTTATGYLYATGDHVKATIGSGVTLECDSINCESIHPTVKPTAIVATEYINAEKIELDEYLSLNAPMIRADLCSVREGRTLTLSAFDVANFTTAAIDGELNASGGDLTCAKLTVGGKVIATLTGAFNSLELDSQGETAVYCETISAGAIDVSAGTTALIARTAAAARNVDVAEGATLRIKPAPPTLESLVVAGTFQSEGPAAIQVTDDVALATIENVDDGRLELLLTVALDEEPTLIGDVVIHTINGTASDFLATATGADSVRFTWKAANDVPCTIEVLNGSDYELVTRAATPVYQDGEYVGSLDFGIANVNGKTFRLYDGAKYLTDVALTAVAPSFYTCTEKKVYGATRYGSIFFAARIINQLTGELLRSSDVDEVYATLYKVDRTSVSSYQRTPVANWNNVRIAPQILDVLQRVSAFNDEFNFIWLPDISRYCMTGTQGTYALLVRIKLTENRNPVSLTFEFDIQ